MQTVHAPMMSLKHVRDECAQSLCRAHRAVDRRPHFSSHGAISFITIRRQPLDSLAASSVRMNGGYFGNIKGVIGLHLGYMIAGDVDVFLQT